MIDYFLIIIILAILFVLHWAVFTTVTGSWVPDFKVGDIIRVSNSVGRHSMLRVTKIVDTQTLEVRP